ncbi:hypothetical protein D7322_14595 [Sphingobacterium puteale]|uniref:Uncharacterized protein n=1 Tax=Sphingobacterium puteale TaxID=2420510 RepID=A0A420VX07_9SPHI|nr:hypothetical protein D7322_14595 [Sphingobacterium puteale]
MRRKKVQCLSVIFCVANLDTNWKMHFFTNANMLRKKDIFQSIINKRAKSAKNPLIPWHPIQPTMRIPCLLIRRWPTIY